MSKVRLIKLYDGGFSREYEVFDGDTSLGIVSKWDGVDGANWTANCKPDGCFCCGFYRTRKEAVAWLWRR